MKVLLVAISVIVALFLIVMQTVCAYGFMVEKDKVSFYYFVLVSVVTFLYLTSGLHDAFKYVVGR